MKKRLRLEVELARVEHSRECDEWPADEEAIETAECRGTRRTQHRVTGGLLMKKRLPGFRDWRGGMERSLDLAEVMT